MTEISKTRTGNFKIEINDVVNYYRADEVELTLNTGNFSESTSELMETMDFDCGDYRESIAHYVLEMAETFRSVSL